MKSNCKIFRTAAALAASAIYEIFPGSELLGGGETEIGFFYQFIAPHPLHSEAMNLLDEKIKAMIREDRPIREMEMVAFSAKELFLKLHHLAAADAMEELEPKELVSIVKIGEFADIIEGPFCSSVQEVGAFHLSKLEFLGDGEYRIEGTAFGTKDELKYFLKKAQKYANENHLVLGREKKLFDQWLGHILWFPKGLLVKKNFISFLKLHLSGAELASPNLSSIDEYALKRVKDGKPYFINQIIEKNVDPEGEFSLFDEGLQSQFFQFIYLFEKDLSETYISCLQSIEKTFIILGFHPLLRLAVRRMGDPGVKLIQGLHITGLPVEVDGKLSARVQWLLEDGIGRSHVAMELKIDELKNRTGGKVFSLRCEVEVERILALLIEKLSGNLPDWLVSEK